MFSFQMRMNLKSLFIFMVLSYLFGGLTESVAQPSQTAVLSAVTDSAALQKPLISRALQVDSLADSLKSAAKLNPVDTAPQPPTLQTNTLKSIDTLKAGAISASTKDAQPQVPLSKKVDSHPKAQESRVSKTPVYQTTRINTIDEMKGKYRSPKKALFMSLVLPGLGQAYNGNYIRSGLYFTAEIALIFGYRHYVYTLQRRQVSKYRKFADSTYSHGKYERWVSDRLDANGRDTAQLQTALTSRTSLCAALYQSGGSFSKIKEGCEKFSGEDTYSDNEYYQLANKDFKLESQGDTSGLTVAEVSRLRQNEFADYQQFYELLKAPDMIAGWRDVLNDDVSIVETENNDQNFRVSYAGESQYLKQYSKMRKRASDLAGMEKFFLGGILLNHLVSGLDAAFSANRHNRLLYQEKLSWYHRLNFHSAFTLAPLVSRSESKIWASLDF